MHLKALLFDLDGTIVDSYKDIGLHLNRTLELFGLEPVELEKVKSMIGGGAKELLKRFFSDGLLEEAIKVFREFYMQKPVIHTKPYGGVKELLDYAKGKGFVLAVVSNKMEELSVKILKELGIYDYFSLVVGGDTYPEKKPSPLPVIETLRKLKVEPKEALMVGDTSADIRAGRLAGTLTGLALWGYVRLEEEKPDYT
ncbi:MAG: HAD family hydrolase, partial [Aquificota bacterium]